MNLYASIADPCGPRTFLARCIRGIEWVLAAEIETRFRPDTITLGHRTVHFSTHATPALKSLQLATADDVFLMIGEIDGIDRTRASLTRLRERAHGLPWTSTIANLRCLRPHAAWASTTIAASSRGKRNYNRYEIEEALAESATAALGLPHRPSRAPRSATPELSIRVHLDGARAVIAARVFDMPLHRRAYKLDSSVGTLHPPLAAAMAMISGLHSSSRVLDPFTGVGTIPIEAKLLQPHALAMGSDIDSARLHHAAANARRADASVDFIRADAGRLPWTAGAFTHVISNVPWQRSVALGGRLAHAPLERDREIARVLSPAGRAVLLVHPDDPVATKDGGDSGMTLLYRSWLSTFGQYPRLCVLVRDGEAGPGMFDANAAYGPALARWAGHANTIELWC